MDYLFNYTKFMNGTSVTDWGVLDTARVLSVRRGEEGSVPRLMAGSHNPLTA
jgi:hypothetical protein